MDGEEIFYRLIKQSMKQVLQANTAQSYLFCSKDSALLILLARLLVEIECGDKFHSPDVKILPQGDKSQNENPPGEKLLVSDIEAVTTTATLTPLELKYKYYILKNGETLNDAASNKLLKTLEEPPKTVKIIILAENEYAVLPTIRSRCRIINPAPLNQTALDLAADLIYKDNPFLHKAKRLSQGSITRLIKAAEGGLQPVEQIVFDILLNMQNSRAEAVYAQLVIKRKDSLAEIVDMFEFVLSDVLLMQAGSIIKLDYRAADVAAIAKFYSADTIIRLKPVIDRARQRLKFFGNAVSITDEFLFSLLEVRQKCQS